MRDADDLAFRDPLASLQRAGLLEYLPTVSRPSASGDARWHGHTGRAEAAVVAIRERFVPAATVISAPHEWRTALSRASLAILSSATAWAAVTHAVGCESRCIVPANSGR